MTVRRKIIMTALVLFLLTTAAVGIGFGIVNLNQYRAGIWPAHPAPDHPGVRITSPLQNSLISLGAPIAVNVEGYHSQKIQSLELFVNGEITAVESAPEGGSYKFFSDFLWTPSTEGEYTLIARAVGMDQMATFSSPLQVMITPADLDLQTEDVLDADVQTQEDLTTPSTLPENLKNQAKIWKGSPANWINSLTSNTPPAPPELAVLKEGCSVMLAIHDLSDNEEGFVVWRHLPGSPSWYNIALLASQSQSEWFSFSDKTAYGGTSYFVTSFNSSGTQTSNLVYVDLDSDDCTPPAEERSVLTFSLENVETLTPVDKYYCYLSLDQIHWMRRPEVGFWYPGGSPQGRETDRAEIIAINQTSDSLRSRNNPLEFLLDCWGWQGTSLQFLGAFSPSINPDQEAEVQVGSEHLKATLSLNIKDFPDRIDFYPMTGDEDDYFDDEYGEFGVSDQTMEELDWFQKGNTIDPGMPFVSALITYSPESCKNHLPPPFQNEFGQFLFCTPFPGFDLGWEGANPQPYLTWGPNQVPMCPDGQGSQCKSYSELLSLAEEKGGEVGFNIFDYNPVGSEIIQITTPELFNYVIPAVPCSGFREFWVQMWYYDGSSFLPVYGPRSNTVKIECPYKLGPKMMLDIRFDEIKFSSLDDDDSGPQSVEVYGYLRASSETMTRYLNWATWNEQADACPDESPNVGFETGGQLRCPQFFINGTYDLKAKPMCQSELFYECTESSWATNNNTIRLVITEYDSLTLAVKLVDWDDISANDLVCQAKIQLPSQSIYEWHKIKGQKFALTGSLTDSGKCQIKGVMNAVEP